MPIRVRTALRLLVVALSLSTATAASVLAPIPEELPPMAFGWVLLLHVERALLLLGLMGFASIVLWRATGGDLPQRVGNIEYEPRRVDNEMWDALSRLDEHICSVEAGLMSVPRTSRQTEENQ